ncbi:hypothetical protein ACFLX4_04120, partial [Chloroflexota bacterium]
METQKASELLKKYLAKLEHLRSLRHDNEEQYQWRHEIMQIVEYAVEKDSDEYKQLCIPPFVYQSDKENQEEYLRDLTRYEATIKQIIQKMYSANWKAIENDFDITKRSFGKKINFVSGNYQRSIIFRDVEHSFVLANLGFSKPAVILAGGVIEELLRLY